MAPSAVGPGAHVLDPKNECASITPSRFERLEKRYQLFSAVYFSGGTLPQKIGKTGTTEGPSLTSARWVKQLRR